MKHFFATLFLGIAILAAGFGKASAQTTFKATTGADITMASTAFTPVTDNNSPTFTPYSIKVTEKGAYTLMFGGSIKMTTANDTLSLAIFKNGTEVKGTETRAVVGSNIEWVPIETFAYFSSLNVGDVINVSWATHTGTTATMHDHRMLFKQD